MALRPPFTALGALCKCTHETENDLECPHIPASYRTVNSPWVHMLPKDDRAGILEYLAAEFDVARLNRVHKHLWFAGLARPARPLHYHALLGRSILVTEQADLHLLWRQDDIFVKPFNDLLGCELIWTKYLTHDQSTFENAAGFILSYIWLIASKSDLRLAHEHGLLSTEIDWHLWTAFSREALSNIDHATYQCINPRYCYGKLRLPQLNWITRWCSLTLGRESLVDGYFSYYTGYASFIQENTTWLAAVLVYIAIALTAMQVGLATTELRSNMMFQRASYGFTVFSLLVPIIFLGAVVLAAGIGYCFNWTHAIRHRYSKKSHLRHIAQNQAVAKFDH